ncbi:hypothetical protein CkaCkLH20_08155 [Colletotrichum karsti]|uniref:Uncharacterized protein n=1 Tax=Colletotrichum karsti TaxID=1095194 RepID=A0A9P6LJ20_9PEZI|nr:uncharacterized protein CkaCkLH20_08155 [Colletotrichum karsti]KAF9874172.1 hypothetical protein CkaCkLH20_08155 [Colletotrichum karsti]
MLFRVQSLARVVDNGREGATGSCHSVSNAATNPAGVSILSRARDNNRGIPNGYLNKLETRLAETEAALFKVLSGHLDSQTYESASSPALLSQAAWTPRQNKVDRVKEWDGLPLQTPNDIQAWYRAKATETNDVITDLPAASPQSLISSVSDQLVIPPSSQRSMSNPHVANDIPIEPQFMEPMTPVNTSRGANGGVSESHSKAKELSKSQHNIYF